MIRAPKHASVVIGSGYGDEGKGLVTDFLAASADGHTLVIRANGGAQAGHTVETAGGKRHVFGHVGAGSFAGASTWLSRFFVSNPVLLVREMAALERLGLRPRILVDPRSPVTTPWDMLINQAAERARGMGRHGSCGVGFGETIERLEKSPYSLHVSDLDKPDLRERLRNIRDLWTVERLQVLGVTPAPDQAALLGSDMILERFMEDVQTFLNICDVADISCLATYDSLIFEGAQGLLLDMDRGDFPFVTRSNTGLKNPLALAAEAGIENLHAIYATRCYATRHGAGPFRHELTHAPGAKVEDQTNRPNPWQGTPRFGNLDLDLLSETIRADLSDAAALNVRVSHDLAVTCLDQLTDGAEWFRDGTRRSGKPELLARQAAESVGAGRTFLSRGPTRTTMTTLCRELEETADIFHLEDSVA